MRCRYSRVPVRCRFGIGGGRFGFFEDHLQAVYRGPKDEIGTILTWLEGYYTKENAPPIMYADKTVKDAKALSEYCNAHPDQDIIKAADEVMPVK